MWGVASFGDISQVYGEIQILEEFINNRVKELCVYDIH